MGVTVSRTSTIVPSTFYDGLSPNTTPTHVGGHEILRTLGIMCRNHLPALSVQVLIF